MTMPDEVWVSNGKYQLLVYKRPVDPLTGKVAYPRIKYTRSDLISPEALRHQNAALAEVLEENARYREALEAIEDKDSPLEVSCLKQIARNALERQPEKAPADG